ncbi:DUF3800 domain-containing protein [bacterium]|nr:DUF3800 domain-containing protein [bacterium]
MFSDCLFIFVDESGNFDFSFSGTKYFILTSVSTLIPHKKDRLEEIKYKSLKNGIEIEYFHATEDKQRVRDEVFEFIGTLPDIEIDSIVIQKNKANPVLYEEKSGLRTKHKGDVLYEKVLMTLLSYIFCRYDKNKNIKRAIVILSSIFTRDKRNLIIKTTKKYFKQNVHIPAYIYFHDCKSDKNSQIADYCSWAIYKKWEHGELRPHKVIGSKIKSEFDMFARGSDIYYE